MMDLRLARLKSPAIMKAAAEKRDGNEARDSTEAAPPLCFCSVTLPRGTAELSPCGEEKGIHATLGAAVSPQPPWPESRSVTTLPHLPVQASPLKKANPAKRERTCAEAIKLPRLQSLQG